MMEHLDAVGQLFYSIGVCDGKLHPREEGILINSLKTYQQALLSSLNKEEVQSISIDNIMVNVAAKELGAWNYFGNFQKYYEAHSQEFSQDLKSLILTSMNQIASSFARQNKSEIILIARTRLLLKPV